MTAGLDRVTATTAQIERHLELAAESGSQLEASLARLRTSRAQLNVLTSALRGRARLGQPGHRVHAAQVRVAAVDLGTNSTRLLVADANGTLDEVVRRLRITRLGEGVDERRKLLPAPDCPRPQCPLGIPSRAGGARSGADTLHRDERGARRRERRGFSGRDRVELRLRDAAPERRRGGGDDVARNRRRRARDSRASTSAAARRSSSSSARTCA